MRMSTYDPYFDEILKNSNKNIFLYNYNFFYLALAISGSPYSSLENIGIALNYDKFKKYCAYVDRTYSKRLEVALNRSLSCLRNYISENTDKTDSSSSVAMLKISQLANEIYLDALSNLRRPFP